MNGYDVIGENDAKTEGTLRARFERASSCSPCILLLRNIDAFAQTTQGLEPGKGGVSVPDSLTEKLTLPRTQHRECPARVHSEPAARVGTVRLSSPRRRHDQ